MCVTEDLVISDLSGYEMKLKQKQKTFDHPDVVTSPFLNLFLCVLEKTEFSSKHTRRSLLLLFKFTRNMRANLGFIGM